jgi:hypothetical protein
MGFMEVVDELLAVGSFGCRDPRVFVAGIIEPMDEVV